MANLLFGDGQRTIQNGCFDALALGDLLGIDHGKALVQFFVAVKQGCDETLGKGKIAVLISMPTGRGKTQGFIITGFGIAGLLLERDDFAQGNLY